MGQGAEKKLPILFKPLQGINMPTPHILLPQQAESLCREITADLLKWFGIPIANEYYAKGCLGSTSFAIKEDQGFIGMLTLEFPFVNNANIFWMGVKRAYQGQQVGTRLIIASQGFATSASKRACMVGSQQE